MSTYKTIDISHPEEGIAVLKLNRPECLNAISWEMVDEMDHYFASVADDYSTRVIILTGEGRGFCSGTDLNSGEQTHPGSNPVTYLYKRQRSLGDMVINMRKIPQPVICAINGVAAGGGFSFTMATDIRIAAESARFICSFINVGLSSGDVGSSYFLPRLIGLSRAAEMLYTGREMKAEEAERVGYVSRVVPDDQVMEASLEIARTMLQKSPFGLRMTKEALNLTLDMPSMEAGIYMENRTQPLAVMTGDFKVAMEAFKEKRPPEFPKEV